MTPQQYLSDLPEPIQSELERMVRGIVGMSQDEKHEALKTFSATAEMLKQLAVSEEDIPILLTFARFRMLVAEIGRAAEAVV